MASLRWRQCSATSWLAGCEMRLDATNSPSPSSVRRRGPKNRADSARARAQGSAPSFGLSFCPRSRVQTDQRQLIDASFSFHFLSAELEKNEKKAVRSADCLSLQNHQNRDPFMAAHSRVEHSSRERDFGRVVPHRTVANGRVVQQFSVGTRKPCCAPHLTAQHRSAHRQREGELF